MTAEEAADRLRSVISLSSDWDEIVHPGIKAERAGFVFMSVMRLARDLCGDELLRAVYGQSETKDRAEALQLIARRLNAASWIFLPFHDEPNGLLGVADEATAVAEGDRPRMFAAIGRRRKHRLAVLKLDALRWESYLEGLGLTVPERQTAIASAFGAEWTTIQRRWKSDVSAKMGPPLDRRLARDRDDAARGLRRWTMKPGESWSSALARSGDRYRQLLRDEC